MKTKWTVVGVVAEGSPLKIGGLNVWDFDWGKTNVPQFQLPHPSHPHQLHYMNVYEISDGELTIRFATGELSMNVWGFYQPA